MAPNSGKFVCRVSTGRQGKSGLGLDAQLTPVEAYLNGGDWTIVEEFTEVESGRAANRPVSIRRRATASGALHCWKRDDASLRPIGCLARMTSSFSALKS